MAAKGSKEFARVRVKTNRGIKLDLCETVCGACYTKLNNIGNCKRFGDKFQEQFTTSDDDSYIETVCLDCQRNSEEIGTVQQQQPRIRIETSSGDRERRLVVPSGEMFVDIAQRTFLEYEK